MTETEIILKIRESLNDLYKDAMKKRDEYFIGDKAVYYKGVMDAFEQAEQLVHDIYMDS